MTVVCLFFTGPINTKAPLQQNPMREFDEWLKSRDVLSGIRDIELVQDKARTRLLELIEDLPMPANNRLLVFRKSSENDHVSDSGF